MKTYLRWFILVAATVAAHAQVADQVQRANISGSGGTSGKCTIEVRVDISAEIDVYGDSGRLRTIAGQPATWTRMECTSALPFSMSDFRFKGVDGRGNVKLLQDPRNNNSMAVIRIDDPRGGAEAYTFEIQWDGASGGAPAGGFTSTGWGDQTAGTTFPSRTGNTGARLPAIAGMAAAATECPLNARSICAARKCTRAARVTMVFRTSMSPPLR